MTKKTLGYVELEWTCPKCGTRNPGPQKTCASCGAPQPQDVQFEQAPQQELVTDQAKLEAAKKGADIHCPYCQARNPADAAVCSQCGGDLKGGERRISGTVVGAFKPGEPVQQVPCPSCQTPNPANAVKCSSCGASLVAPAPAPVLAPAPAAGAKPNRRLLVIGSLAGVLLVAACLFLAFSMLRSKNVVGQVQSANWERRIAVEELRDVAHSAWQDEIPAEASLGACEPRYRFTQSEAAPHATEVCGTPYTKDTGSGYAEVMQDCEYQVYDDYCQYTVQEWAVVDQFRSSGSDSRPAWPQYSLTGSQRLGERTEAYQVVFTTDGGLRTLNTSDADLFARLQPGSSWTLVINGLGQVVGVEPR